MWKIMLMVTNMCQAGQETPTAKICVLVQCKMCLKVFGGEFLQKGTWLKYSGFRHQSKKYGRLRAKQVPTFSTTQKSRIQNSVMCYGHAMDSRDSDCLGHRMKMVKKWFIVRKFKLFSTGHLIHKT